MKKLSINKKKIKQNKKSINGKATSRIFNKKKEN